jgi:hypothetical protein
LFTRIGNSFVAPFSHSWTIVTTVCNPRVRAPSAGFLREYLGETRIISASVRPDRGVGFVRFRFGLVVAARSFASSDEMSTNALGVGIRIWSMFEKTPGKNTRTIYVLSRIPGSKE